LRSYDDDLTLYTSDFSAFESQEVSDFISSIPYRNDATSSWFVDPELKYNDTILAGNGNCSNLAFGAMYGFIETKKQAAIVHLLQKDLRFLYGDGHTVLSVNIENQSAILDVLEGRIPLQNQNYIDAQRFKYSVEDVFTHIALSNVRDGQNEYFTNRNEFGASNYLQAVELGLIPQNEIVDYFKFLDRFYVPLGDAYIEKLIYDTLSLVFGYYPNIYVDESFFWEIYSNVWLKVFFAYVFLISFHLLYITFVLLLAQCALSLYKEKRKV